MSVTEIKRYRAKCDCCGGLGDLRDTHNEAVAHAIERQHWALVIPGPVGAESLLCQPCQQECEAAADKLDDKLKSEREATATRALALAAKAVVLDHLMARWREGHHDDTVRSQECRWWLSCAEKILAEERAKRGLA